jgi:branched-subunit amino acid ABC-type transport system permease component
MLNGLALGSVYALISTGFSIIFNVLKFSNFAHGAVMTFCAFSGYYIAAANGLGLVPTILTAVITGILVALAGEFIAFRRITLRKTYPIYFFVSSITLGALFDEPSLGLAPIIVNNIFKLILKIRDLGITVFLVEQNARKALSICDKACALENGRISLTGSGKELLASDMVKKAYLGG